ncbi:hypothetical protein NC651_025726 [Populus alba x Populus x berolinensis]|nr:hypothetical protein NC651_025726 [Populus alba x Populus x berolinensis]
MALMVAVLFAILFQGYVSSASDPDPVRDFCIANTDSATNIPCKNSSDATVEDFIFSGIISHGKFSETGLASIPVNVNNFPGLNTLGMSLVRADFEAGGVNVPHFHPRATEVAYVLEGKIYSGFVDTQNKVFAKVLEKGEVMVFPKGLVHFQMNVGDKPATIVGSFNSENPGSMKIPTAVFGCGIKEELLEKAFGLKGKDISKKKKTGLQKMALMVRILFVILFIGSVASDPDPVQDYCIAVTDSETYMPCKNPSLVTVEDFIFSGLNSTGNFSETGQAVLSVNVNNFPGLRTQGVSLARADFKVGGFALPHAHPRATEAVCVLEGTFYSGFIDSQQKVFAKVIEQGDVIVIPRGLVHFHKNVGEIQGTLLGIYNSENPGKSMFPTAAFGCEVKEELLEKVYGLSAEDISKVRGKLHLCGKAEAGFN